DANTVDFLGAGPALRSAQDDCRPPRRRCSHAARAGCILNVTNPYVAGVEGLREITMDSVRLIACHLVHFVAVGLQQLSDVIVANTTKNGGPGDLELVEMEDGQHRAISRGIEKTNPLPGPLERPRLGFAVTDDAGDEQIGVVKRSPKRMHQGVAEFSA